MEKMEKLSKFFVLLLLCAVSFNAMAQIKGKVTDEDGIPLPGVTVLEKGTGNGTVTNLDGIYNLQLKSESGAVLVFSFVGLEIREIKVGSNTEINVVLKTNAMDLDEVIVVGYGTMRKSDLTGSISKVSSKDLEDQQFNSVLETLQGRAAGVQVTTDSGEPGAGISIKIRGTNSLLGDNAPLFVVDGMPISATSNASESMYIGSDPLSNLNPNDIESIEILKDASAIAIYGSRASNGVVLITTKTAKPGTTKVDVTARYSVVEVPNLYDRISGSQYALLKNQTQVFNRLPATYEEMMLDGSFTYDGVDDEGNPDPMHPHPDNAPAGVDVFDIMFRRGQSKDYQVSVSGGTNKFSQLVSASLSESEGSIIDSWFKRGGLKYNSKLQIGEKFSLISNLTLSHTQKSRVNTSFESTAGGVMFGMARISPFLDMTKPTDVPDLDESGNVILNPYLEVVGRDYINKSDDAIANFALKYDLTKSLSLNVRVGGTYRNNTIDDFENLLTRNGYSANGKLSKNRLKHTSVVSETYINHLAKIGKHSLNSTVGVGYENVIQERLNLSYVDFTFMDQGYHAPQLSLSPMTYNGIYTNYTLQSGFFRFNYSYNNRYLLTFTGRADGSSKFSQGGKWGFFPTGAIAWRVSQEQFIKDLNIFSNLKVRASYGDSGNQAISPYGTLATFESLKLSMGLGELYTGSYSSRIANKELTWETTTSLDVGLEMGFFDNRLSVEVDYYEKHTKDLLMNLSIPAQTGFTIIPKNVGSLENKGLEFSISATPIRKKNFSWSTNLNISNNKTTITDLGGLEYLETSRIGAGMKNSPTRLYEGGTLGEFFVYKGKGLSQLSDFVDYENDDSHELVTHVVQDEEGNDVERPKFIPYGTESGRPGEWKFEDINNDGIINEDDRILEGNANPDFTFGWSNSFKYKNFDLSFLFQGSYGNDVLNVSSLIFSSGASYSIPTTDYYNKMWTLENQHNDPRYPVYSQSVNDKLSTVQVEDASYVRLKSLVLKYNFKTSGISWLKNASVFVSGSNLLTITKYSGQDPEVSSKGKNVMAPGVDFGAYPRPKLYTVGLNVSF
jgi:TonB-linked SusC/RagA family outer membrane protein